MWTYDLQSVVLHRLQVRTARDEVDVLSGSGQPRAEITPDRSRPHHGNLHLILQ